MYEGGDRVFVGTVIYEEYVRSIGFHTKGDIVENRLVVEEW